jgi:hypothetical protein
MKVAWAGSRHAVEVNDRMARLVASDPVSIHTSIQPSPIRFDSIDSSPHPPTTHGRHGSHFSCHQSLHLLSPKLEDYCATISSPARRPLPSIHS